MVNISLSGFSYSYCVFLNICCYCGGRDWSTGTLAIWHDFVNPWSTLTEIWPFSSQGGGGRGQRVDGLGGLTL